MRVLALDAATESCSVALLVDDRLLVRQEESGKSHAQKILDMVAEVLAQGEISLSSLDGIAAGVGPGSFTGVRVGVAVAQGLAFGAGLPVVPVMTLEALAMEAAASGADEVLACLDARMGEVYWGCFAADTLRGVAVRMSPRVGSPSTVHLPDTARLVAARLRGIGRGFAAYPELAGLPGLELHPADSRALPNARDMARLAVLRLGAGEGIDPAALSPVYIRDRVALTEVERRAAKR